MPSAKRGNRQMQIQSVYIIKRDTGVCMYHHDFVESDFDPDLLSSFLVAMTSFFDEATSSITSRARAFEGTDHKIIVEFGEWTLGAVAAVEDTEDVRTRMRRLLDAFEDQFALLRWVELDLAVYTRFERNVVEEFVRDQIAPETQMELKDHWEFYTSRPDVISFLKLIPEKCTVQEAAEFLEVPLELAMNMAAEAYWEKAISITESAKPDDIYQTTSLSHSKEEVDGISPDTAKALSELDGQTPLSIAAERVKTADLRRFLDDIAVLAHRRTVERVSPSQATMVLYTSVLQELLSRCATILGVKPARGVFLKARNEMEEAHSWLVYVGLEEGIDVEVKSSLISATIRGSITPESISEGFGALFLEFVHRLSSLVGSDPVNSILVKTRNHVEKQFPQTAYDIHWETLEVK
ncbi:MAG: hypothetical protein JSW05_10270 [Candidatus Thorarchaeota archaeon]|nr:MAG: hypothetical protein JSW05_10270 [Candidatus Thorarchaeota archaeon]